VDPDVEGGQDEDGEAVFGGGACSFEAAAGEVEEQVVCGGSGVDAVVQAGPVVGER
jgi:hypothetical protein